IDRRLKAARKARQADQPTASRRVRTTGKVS
ncbi:MAG TPA: electron transport complex subunit RsxE, partial [Alcanivorax sp.]|nr:electron transport complex subunit RsxE [Alcanivorax sp.]